jgi:hypothetical protein
MNHRREIFIALPVSAMKQALSKLERLLHGQIYVGVLKRSQPAAAPTGSRTPMEELPQAAIFSAHLNSLANHSFFPDSEGPCACTSTAN